MLGYIGATVIIVTLVGMLRLSSCASNFSWPLVILVYLSCFLFISLGAALCALGDNYDYY